MHIITILIIFKFLDEPKSIKLTSETSRHLCWNVSEMIDDRE